MSRSRLLPFMLAVFVGFLPTLAVLSVVGAAAEHAHAIESLLHGHDHDSDHPPHVHTGHGSQGVLLAGLAGDRPVCPAGYSAQPSGREPFIDKTAIPPVSTSEVLAWLCVLLI